MLSDSVINTVKATAPVLEEHGETITQVFYKRLFENHPELLNIFNHRNQQGGQQARALADAVYAYAVNIEDPSVLMPHVQRICAKHASLGIRPEHYPIVGTHLLGAIKEVLGEAANDTIIDSWGQAYQMLADLFIATEKQMYSDSADKQGGWQGLRRFVVVKKVKESEWVSSFYLVPLDGGALPDFRPGQYVSVHVMIDGQQHIRQYSLSDEPGQEYLRISVKREALGEPGAVSNYLHDHIQEGDNIEITPPAGVFCLSNDQAPLVLLSAGVGATPMMSMLKTALSETPDRSIQFIYSCENQAQHTFKEAVKDITERRDNVSSTVFYRIPETGLLAGQDYDHEGMVSLSVLGDAVPVNGEFYLCGPMPFMQAMQQQLLALGVDEAAIHYEVFGPTTAL